MARKLIPNDIIEQMAAEYTDGASSYELAEKYGLHPASIRRLMVKRGLGKGKGNGKGVKGRNKGHEAKLKYAFERCDALTLEASNGTIELVEWISKSKGRYLCHVCGTEWYRYNDTTRCPKCPTCDERERAQREQERLDRERERAEELAKDKNCKVCGCVFHSEIASRVFCSKECAKKDKIRKKNEREKRKTAKKQAEEIKKEKVCKCCGAIFHSTYATRKLCDECQTLSKYCDHKLRALKYGVEYDPSVKLNKLIERDSNICQICGFPCDRSDNRWSEKYGPLSPTIDHIIAMVNGGGHTWENVQLAHAICNSVKRDLGSDELTDEVISYAKKQAIRYKLA